MIQEINPFSVVPLNLQSQVDSSDYNADKFFKIAMKNDDDEINNPFEQISS